MFVKNAIVKMDWEVENFVESKSEGFIAAIQIYPTENHGDVAVMFKDGVAFMIYDEDVEEPASRTELLKALKEIVDDGGAKAEFEDYFPDAYIEVSTGATVDENIAEIYGFSEEQCQDILDRLDDLSGYVETVLEDA